jgi:hypothetical protein
MDRKIRLLVMLIPHLDLTQGQVAFALNLGEPPPDKLFNQLNYLRLKGIPFPPARQRVGRGHHLRYEFGELIEIGVAIYALQNGSKLIDLLPVFVGQRQALRAVFRSVMDELPEAALRAHWVRSKGKQVPILADETWLVLHDRHSQAPGTHEVVIKALSEKPSQDELFEFFMGQQPRGHVPLKRMILQWTAWALEAPEIRGASTS